MDLAQLNMTCGENLAWCNKEMRPTIHLIYVGDDVYVFWQSKFNGDFVADVLAET
jgi:hypothetical protein